MTSSRRGAFAGTRWVHFNYKSKEQASPKSSEINEKINTDPRSQVYEELVERRNNSKIFRSFLWGALEDVAPAAM
jgi:hypothetical protein